MSRVDKRRPEVRLRPSATTTAPGRETGDLSVRPGRPAPESFAPASARPAPLELSGRGSVHGRPLPEPHVQELRAYALALKAQGVPAVEQLGLLSANALHRYQAMPGLTQQERMDATMRDLAGAILGPTARTLLDEFSKVATLGGRVPLPASALVDRFRQGLGAAGLESMPHGGHRDNLDPTAGLDFKAGFRDGSQNQLFHTFAFVYLQYVGDNELVSRGANLKHELLDFGGSSTDFHASHAGMLLGGWLRDLRDGKGELSSVPALLVGALSKDGARAGAASAPWNAGQDQSALAKTANDRFQHFLDDPGPGLRLLDFVVDNFSREKVVADVKDLGGTVAKAKRAAARFFAKLKLP